MQQEIKKNSPDELFKIYRNELDNQEYLNEIVKSLEPTINYTLSSVNATQDKVLQAQAKVIAAESVLSYDPDKGSSLPTYVTNNLKKVHRTRRQNNSPIKIADRLHYDHYAIQNAENEFMEQYNREPTLLELADKSGVSMKKINKIKNEYTMMYTNESSFGGNSPEKKFPEYTEEAMDYIYYDADFKDKKILEHSAGYGGSQILDDAVIAEKLGMSVSQISRRRAALAAKIYEIQTELEEQYNN